MSVELQPIGVGCNSKCSYCYQEPIRDGGNTSARGKYDIDLMIQRGLSLSHALSMYGGEALLVPKVDLEKVFKASFDQTEIRRKQIDQLPASKEKQEQLDNLQGPGVQTNGDLIDAEHIEMFKKYRVGVGVSIDGPGELNSLRISRSTGDWKEPTQKTMDNLVALRQAGVSVSIIVTLHRENGIPERLEVLKRWGLWLASIGIAHVNVHTLESESPLLKLKYALSEEQERAAMLNIAAWLEENPELQWVPFKTMKNMLQLENKKANCVWHFCDPLTTPAVQAVLADGSMTNCGRTAKEGVPWLKASQVGYDRYISLYQTPQEMGGCKGCRFFMVCGGHCPGEGENQDWRLKTDHCRVLMDLFGFYEDQLIRAGITPISLKAERPRMEAALMNLFRNGQRPANLSQLEMIANDPKYVAVLDHGDSPHGDSHGDHTDAQQVGCVVESVEHGDSEHGDSPHGDSHGDHNDAAAAPTQEIQPWKG